MNANDLRIYVAYEPEQALHAGRIDGWTRTDPPEPPAGREDLHPDDDAALALRDALRSAIDAADVVVCLISRSACRDPWIDWELRAASSADPPKPLVGVLLGEFNVHPPAMVDRGAVFVPFRRDTVDRAITWAHDLQATSDDYMLKDF